jgi:hypothetical protein
MLGYITGSSSLVKQQNQEIMSTHYFLHREALLGRTSRVDLKFFIRPGCGDG